MPIIDNGIIYEKIFTKELKAVGFVDGYWTKNLKIPPTVNNMSVTEISRNAFANSQIETLEIPHNLRIIGESAFAFCSNLKSVKISFAWFEEEKEILLIRERAFYDCWLLKTFTGNRTLLLKSNAFCNCFDLEEIDTAIQRMEENAIVDCASLHQLIFAGTTILPTHSLYGSSVKELTFLGDAIISPDTIDYIATHNVKIRCSKNSNLPPLAYSGLFIEILEKD